MGYQIATVVLKDGRQFDRVVIIEGNITQVAGYKDLPFTEENIRGHRPQSRQMEFFA
jgi:hypothetical protein